MSANSARAALVTSLLFSVHLCLAQIDRTALDGMVRDPAGKRIPHARIVLVHRSTGLLRETVCSATGTYDLPGLPVGRYRVTVSATGFEDAVYPDVALTAGLTRTLSASLAVGSSGEQIQVSTIIPQLDTTSDALGASFEREQVQQLPLNGRNWSNLTALAPGAVDTGGSNQRSVRFSGRGLDDNNFTYDGIDATNIVNQAQQPFVRLAIPTDAIQEFRVDTMLFTAENGSTPGGQIAVVSKNGVNVFHGGLFEFLRNDIFDAREPIDALNAHKPAFRLNQFGSSLGGPIIHDRTFFYTTYEGLRQTLGQTLPGFVPTDTFRAQAAAASLALAPILAAYPEPTRVVSPGSGLPNFIGSGRQLDREDSGMVRVDRRFSPAYSAYARFNFDSAVSTVPLAGGGSYAGDRQQIESRPINAEVEFLHIFAPTLVNEVKFGFNRGNVYTTNLSSLGLPYAVAASGFTSLASNQYKLGVGNSFASIDNLTLVRGAHTFKVGAEVRRIQLNQGNTASGTITFSSPTNLSRNAVSSANYASALPTNGLRKTHVYAYAQDEWRALSGLTLNLGLRYSFFNVFHEVLGRAIPFDFATCGDSGFCGAGASFGQRNFGDFDPRLALTWAPSALHGKTLVRAGFGLYHGDGQLDDQNLPFNNEVARYSLTGVANLSFPVTPFFVNTPGIVSPRDMDRTRPDSYVSQWGLSLQQALPHELVATLSYDGAQGTKLLTTSYLNLLDPVTHLRVHPAFGQVEFRGNRNSSSYQALTGAVGRTFTNGLLLGANYTYSNEIDQDAAGGGDSDFPQDPACLSCERASGDFDVRHNFHANAVYLLPFGRGHALASSGVARLVLGGWSTTTIVGARSGLPINVTVDRSSNAVSTGYTINQRPDRVPGVLLTPPAGRSPTHWLNPAAFSPVGGSGYGNAPRNLARGPNLWQADLGLGKAIPVSEHAQLQFRADFFNIFNRAQYGLPLADSSSPSFGQILSTVNTGPVGTGTPRQTQLSLRLDF